LKEKKQDEENTLVFGARERAEVLKLTDKSGKKLGENNSVYFTKKRVCVMKSCHAHSTNFLTFWREEVNLDWWGIGRTSRILKSQGTLRR